MSFELTETGIQEAERIVTKRGGPEPAVLNFMYDRGSRPGSDIVIELDDVIEETHMNDEKATSVLRRLVNLGYVEEK